MTMRAAGPGREDARSALRLVAAGAGALYAGLVPLHLLWLSGPARVVMPVLAAASAALLVAVAATATRWQPHGRAVDALMLVPLVNSLTHIAVTGQLHQTTTVMLSLAVVGAVASSRRTGLAVVGAGLLAGWPSSGCGRSTSRP